MLETKEDNNLEKHTELLTDEEIKVVTGGADDETLKVSGKTVPLPEAKSKKECDGGYAGNIIPKTTDTTNP